MMDAEQERAQEQRMIKRLATLQQAGHDVSGLKAHYEGQHMSIRYMAAKHFCFIFPSLVFHFIV